MVKKKQAKQAKKTEYQEPEDPRAPTYVRLFDLKKFVWEAAEEHRNRIGSRQDYAMADYIREAVREKLIEDGFIDREE